jgi:hypothetical protein
VSGAAKDPKQHHRLWLYHLLSDLQGLCLTAGYFCACCSVSVVADMLG